MGAIDRVILSSPLSCYWLKSIEEEDATVEQSTRPRASQKFTLRKKLSRDCSRFLGKLFLVSLTTSTTYLSLASIHICLICILLLMSCHTPETRITLYAAERIAEDQRRASRTAEPASRAVNAHRQRDSSFMTALCEFSSGFMKASNAKTQYIVRGGVLCLVPP